MVNLSKISFEPISVYFGYDYTLTEEGQAMLPPDIKPLGEGEKSNKFSGWDFLPFLFSHPKMAKSKLSWRMPDIGAKWLPKSKRRSDMRLKSL